MGCWLCGFDDFLYKLAADPEYVECFFEKVWTYQKEVIEQYYGRIGRNLHYTSSGDEIEPTDLDGFTIHPKVMLEWQN